MLCCVTVELFIISCVPIQDELMVLTALTIAPLFTVSYGSMEEELMVLTGE
jgi:hypothetical protein